MTIESSEQATKSKEILAKKGISLGIYLTAERGISRLEPLRDRIENVSYATLLQVTREMPIQNVDIGIFDSPDRVIPELGIGGYAHEGLPQSQVEIDLDPESDQRESAIERELRRTLRHELHHDVRIKYLGSDQTLLQRVISEGLAQFYEIEGTEEEPPIYATALKPEEIQEYLEQIKASFESKREEDWNDYFFGSVEKNIPKWSGYTVGFYIVGEYLKKHPDKKASTLYDTPAEAFFS